MEAAIEGLEHTFLLVLHLVRVLLDVTAAFWIAVGSVFAMVELFAAHVRRQAPALYKSIRLRFAGYLSVGLEFLLAADILSTAIAPTFEELGKLAVIAVIRTGLNYFLAKEMHEQREDLARDREARVGMPHDPLFHPVPPTARA